MNKRTLLPRVRLIRTMVKLGMTILLALFWTPIKAGTGWESGGISISGMSVDGSPAIAFDLGSLTGSPEFNIGLTLEHRMEARSSMKPLPPNSPPNQKPEYDVRSSSEWIIPQLTSYLIPKSRDYLVWKQPSGGEVYFKTGLISNEFNHAGATDWQIRRGMGEVFEIRHRENGLLYRFLKGQWSELRHEGTSRTLRVTSVLGKVTKMEQSECAAPLLEALYNEQGKVTALKIGNRLHRFEWNGTALKAWNNGWADSWMFSYTSPANGHRLLKGFTTPSGDKEDYKWTVNGAYDPALAEKDAFAKPYVLISSRDYKYAVGKTQRGWEFAASDHQGNRSNRLTYNPASGLVERSNPDGSVFAYSQKARLGGDTLLRKVMGPNGVVLLDNLYDENGLLKQRSQFGGIEESYLRDPQGRIVEVKRKGKVWTTFAYEGALRKPSEVRDAQGASLKIRYDEKGQPAVFTDADGYQHRFTYDSAGRPLTHELPTGNLRKFSYDTWGRIQEKIEPDGSRLRVSLNEFDLVTMAETISSYGAKHHWEYKYDALGRLLSVQRDGKPWQSWERKLLDKNGTETIQTDPLGNKTTTELNTRNQLVRVENALGETMRYEYDQLGDLMNWKDARGASMIFQRDTMGRIVGQIDGLGRRQFWQYDDLGRMVNKFSGEQQIKYHRNEDGKLTSIDYGGDQRISVDYSEDGHISEARTEDTSTKWEYDLLGRPTTKLQSIRGVNAQAVKWTYTAGGRKKSVAWIGNSNESVEEFQNAIWKPNHDLKMQVTEYCYDGLGRITKILVNGKEEVTCKFDEKTLRIAEKTFSSGLKLQYAYDQEGRPAALLAIDSDGNAIRAVQYNWNEIGQLTQRTLVGFTEFTITQEYAYDAIGRLREINCPAAPHLQEKFVFDASGNILTKTLGNKTKKMSYDLANQLISSESDNITTEFSYDRAGRMTGEINTELVNGETKTSSQSFTYGYLDKITNISRGDGETAFHYGADGMLMGKTNGSGTESWAWDGIALLSRGSEMYVNEPHASGGIPLFARKNKVVENADAEDKTPAAEQADRILLNDYLGTTLDTLSADQGGESNSSSDSLDRGVLSAMGESNSKGSSERRFTGKPYDPDMNGYVFPYRNYRADIGRWNSADPSGFPDGPNGQFYAPVPTHGIDPLGLAEVSTTSSTVNVNVSDFISNWALISQLVANGLDLSFQVKLVAEGSGEGSNASLGDPTTSLTGTHTSSFNLTIGDTGYSLGFTAKADSTTLLNENTTQNSDGTSTITKTFKVDLKVDGSWSLFLGESGTFDIDDVELTLSYTTPPPQEE